MSPWFEGRVMDGVSISAADKESGSPKPGDMIATNKDDITDEWLVAESFFKDNYELAQQELIDNHAKEINAMAKGMWDALNEIDYDPMHPQWEHFDDPIKDAFISAAGKAFVSLQSGV